MFSSKVLGTCVVTGFASRKTRMQQYHYVIHTTLMLSVALISIFLLLYYTAMLNLLTPY